MSTQQLNAVQQQTQSTQNGFGKVQLGAASSPHATAADVQYFQGLMAGGKAMLKNGNTTMAPNTLHVTENPMLEETALQLSKAEYAVDYLHGKLKRGMATLDQESGPNTTMIQDIVSMQHTSTMYFVGVNIVGNSGDSVTEASQSITRGR